MEKGSEKKYGKSELDKIKKEIDRLDCVLLSVALVISILCGGL